MGSKVENSREVIEFCVLVMFSNFPIENFGFPDVSSFSEPMNIFPNVVPMATLIPLGLKTATERDSFSSRGICRSPSTLRVSRHIIWMIPLANPTNENFPVWTLGRMKETGVWGIPVNLVTKSQYWVLHNLTYDYWELEL